MKRSQVKKIRFLGRVLFFLYLLFIVYFLIFAEIYGRSGIMAEYHYNLVLFKEINRFIQYRHELGAFAVFANLFGNILIFVPYGFLLPMSRKGHSFLETSCHSFFVSLCVEILQLVTKVGSFDVDDLFLNTLGGIIGYILFVICNALRRRYFAKKR